MDRPLPQQSKLGNNVRLTTKPLTIKQLQSYPPEASKTYVPEATNEGSAQVAKGRDGPFDLHYKIHGQGPTRIIFISGLATGLELWYEVVHEFGVQNSDRYTSLIYENRGIGQSKAPWSLWSIKDLAKDAKDLLNHVNWIEERSVHIVGHSMGGMIAMELALLDPTLPQTLTLLSTTSNYRRDLRLSAVTKSILTAPLLLTPDSRLTATKSQGFGQTWLNAPDPTNTFPTNGDAWAAKYLTWPAHNRAAFLQSPAVYRHRVNAADLRALAKQLGEGRVAIMHGSGDRTIPVAAAEKTWEEFGGKDAGVGFVVFDGVGHIPIFERLREVIAIIEGVVNGTLTVSGSGSQAALRS